MSDKNRALLLRGYVIMMFIALASMSFVTLAPDLLQDRQQGLGIAEALANALSRFPGRVLPIYGTFIVILAVGVGILLSKRFSVPRWQRLRLLVIVASLPMVLVTLARMIYLLVVRSASWESSDGILVAFALAGLVMILACWRTTPSPERAYAIETGDNSRLKDERYRLVEGQAANTTLSVFLMALLFGGVLYETLVTGQWPVRTLVEIALICVILAGSILYWNRRY